MKNVSVGVVIAISLFLTMSLSAIVVYVTRTEVQQTKNQLAILQNSAYVHDDAELAACDHQTISGSIVKQMLDYFSDKYMFQTVTGECQTGFYGNFGIHDEHGTYYVNDTKMFKCYVGYVSDSTHIEYVQFISTDVMSDGYQPPEFDKSKAADVLAVAKLNTEIAEYQYLIYERGN